MERMKLKELRRLVKIGAACLLSEGNEPKERLRQIAYSTGEIGMNGALLQDAAGELWAIVGRSSLLFKYC